MDIRKAIEQSGGDIRTATDVNGLIEGYRELVAALLLSDTSCLRVLMLRGQEISPQDALQDFRRWCQEPWVLCLSTKDIDRVMNEYQADALRVLDCIAKDWYAKFEEVM